MDVTKRQITKIAREVSRFTVRSLRREGVGSGELDVLHAVRKTPGISQSEICRLTGQDKGAVARIAAGLEKKGYITRRADPCDGRSRLLFPTPEAEKLKGSKAHLEACFYDWLLECLEEEQKEAFSHILNILYERCKNESKGGFVNVAERVENCYEK